MRRGEGSDAFAFTLAGATRLLEVRGREERSVDGSALTRKRQSFVFDHILPPTADQAAVFDAAQPLMQSVVDGYSVLVFAYGHTSSGKTFTMEGPGLGEGGVEGERVGRHMRAVTSFTQAGDAAYEQRGLMQRSVEELFTQVHTRRDKQGWAYHLTLSVLELSPRGDTELISDLLAADDTQPHELKQVVRAAGSTPTVGSANHGRLDVVVTKPVEGGGEGGGGGMAAVGPGETGEAGGGDGVQ